jgi:outer membrane biosynthesis protein TonB
VARHWRSGRRRPAVVVLVAAVAVVLGSVAGPARAQLLEPAPEETTTTAPVAETTIPTTTAPPATEPPATEPAPAPTPPPTTAAPTTTQPPTTLPETIPTTAPPEAPTPAPTTSVVAPERITVTQSTPDLSGVLTLWVLGILGTLGTLAVSWWRQREGGAG